MVAGVSLAVKEPLAAVKQRVWMARLERQRTAWTPWLLCRAALPTLARLRGRLLRSATACRRFLPSLSPNPAP